MTINQRFITIEGGEGVGKSLFCQGLVQGLRSEGHEVCATREPGGSKLAEKIRELFISPPDGETLSPTVELFLLSAARSQHLTQLVRPALAEGQWVLCDRYIDSTRVYQGALGGLAREFIETVLRESTQGLVPALTFLLDCPVETSLGRLSQRASQSSTEVASRYDSAKREFHLKLRQEYLKLAHAYPERFIVLDASQSPAKLVSLALAAIKQLKST